MLYPPLLGINKPSDDDDDDVLRKVNVIEVIGNYTDYMKLSPGVTSKMVYVPRSTCFKKFMNIKFWAVLLTVRETISRTGSKKHLTK